MTVCGALFGLGPSFSVYSKY